MGFRSKKEKINGKAFIMIALLVFLVSGAWGACQTGNWSVSNCRGAIRSSCSYGLQCGNETTCDNSVGGCGSGCPAQCGGYVGIRKDRFSYCDNSTYPSCRIETSPVTSCYYTTYCDTQCERDSVICVNDGKEWTTISGGTCNGKGCLEHCDSTYHCESVYTENNVVRSNITLTDCHGDVLQERQVLGSCSENGFCEGEEVAGSDSCSYPEPDPDKCKFGGQNGSLCTYVCPDGKLHSCRIAWTPGQPSEYQNCPQKPPSDCVTPASSSSVVPDDSIPDYPTFTSSSSTSPEPDPDCPECDYLEQIRDTLHRANEQRRFIAYTVDSIKADVGGFGAQFNSIISNTAITANKLNTSNSSLSSIASTNSQIADKLNSLDLDNITASVDSVVVHVDMSRDTVPWYFTADLDSLPVWRDTISETNRLIRDITSQVDTLVQDSAGDNILKKFLPYVKKTFDKIEDFYSGYTLPAMLDSLQSRLGLDTLTLQEQNEVAERITRLSDSTYVEGNWYCEEHPDDVLCVELDSAELVGLVAPDSFDFVQFMHEQDSIKAWIDSTLRDTTEDTLSLKDLAGDSALIREKLDFLFLPGETIEECFEFRMNTRLNGWAINLLIDFGDIFGWDWCDLVRKIVRLVTFILIVVTTIKGYIRAFGGGGPGGG